MLNKLHLRHSGFTLVELMIVIVIVAILAGIALPSYQSHIRKSHRKEAIASVHSLAGRLERARSNLMSYISFNEYESTQFTYYRYEIEATASTYTITATPSARQDKDPCGTMTYDEQGQWTFAGDATPAKVDQCL